MTEQNQQIKPFLRVFNTDVDGTKPIIQAIQKVNGIGFSMANAILTSLKISKTTKAGLLSDEDARRIEKVVRENKLPKWMENRRNDTATGETIHIIGADLRFAIENDVKKMRRLKTYRGVRHSLGQPVRGQRTRSHFRHGRAVGVQKTKVAKTAASAPAKDSKKDSKSKEGKK